jgi:hypothetical protein
LILITAPAYIAAALDESLSVSQCVGDNIRIHNTRLIGLNLSQKVEMIAVGDNAVFFLFPCVDYSLESVKIMKLCL